MKSRVVIVLLLGLLSIGPILVGCQSESSPSPSQRYGEQGQTYKRNGEFGPNVLYPDYQTAYLSAYLERTNVPIEQHVQVCYRSLANGTYYDPANDAQTEDTETSSCKTKAGGWKAVPFTAQTEGMGEPATEVAFSAQDHWIYTYSDPGDQTQTFLLKFENVKLTHIRVKLSGLEHPEDGYEVRMVVGGKLFANRLVLRLPPKPQEEHDWDQINFVALADLKTWDRSNVQLKVRDQVARLFDEGRAHLAILPGDVSNQAGTSAHYANTYFRTYDKLLNQIPFYPIHGNHDLYPLELLGDVSQDGWHFFRMFQLPPNPIAESILHRGPDGKIDQSGYRAFYSFDWGNVHFIALDAPDYDSPGFNEYGKDSVQYRWLEKDLERAQGATWRIAYFHNPVGNPDQRSPQMADLVELMYKKRVSLVVSGHWETPVLSLDQPQTPAWLVVPSGGARSRYYKNCPDRFGLVALSATERNLKGQFINADGQTMGDFTLAPQDPGQEGSTKTISQTQNWRSCPE